MIVTSKDQAMKEAMWKFLHVRGVQVARSDDFQALGRLGDSGALIGVVGYNGFNGQIACIHSAGDGHWVSREFILATFDYPFRQLKLKYLIAPVASNNFKALKFDRRMGFQDWATLPDGFAEGIDIILLRMERSQCRWIRPEVIQQLRKRELAWEQ